MFKKGNIVTFNASEGQIIGMVKSIGKTAMKVRVADGLYNIPITKIKGITLLAEKAPLPVGLEGLEIKGLKEHMGRDGICFTANLYNNGNKIATLSNSGDGGCNDIYFYSDVPDAEAIRTKAIQLVQSDIGKGNFVDGEESTFFVDFLLNVHSEYGGSWENFCKDTIAFWKDLHEKYPKN